MSKLLSDKCPICDGLIPLRGRAGLYVNVETAEGIPCQCMYGGKAHPEEQREKRMQVVFSHMYLLTSTQINHVLHLQKAMHISYSDERSMYLSKLEDAYNKRRIRNMEEKSNESD